MCYETKVTGTETSILTLPIVILNEITYKRIQTHQANNFPSILVRFLGNSRILVTSQLK